MKVKLWNKHTESALSNYQKLSESVNYQTLKTYKEKQRGDSSLSNDSEERKIKLIPMQSIRDSDANNQTKRSSESSLNRNEHTHITVDKWNGSHLSKFSPVKSKLDSFGANSNSHSSFFKVS